MKDWNNSTYYPGNISDYLMFNAGRHPDKPALLHPVRITYKELQAEVDRHSFALESAGIGSGTRTIIMVPAGPEFFILTFALLRIGAIPVMIDPGMGIKAMVNALKVIHAEAFIGIPRAQLLRLIRPSVFSKVKTLLTTGTGWIPGVSRLKDFPGEKDVNYPSCRVDPGRTAAIFFTSGSTGPAKGVVYSAGMMNSQIRITQSQFNIGQEEIDLCTFPLLGLFAVCHGNSSVIADMDMIRPARLDPARVIGNIRDFGCTQMFGSPMILKKLAQFGLANQVRLPSLRKVISAGAPVHRHILESFGRLLDPGAEIHTPYGATEVLPVTDIFASELLVMKTGGTENENGICIGLPINGLVVKIIQITDDPVNSWTDVNQVPANEVGEIAVKGPWVTTDYFRNPEANRLAKIFDPEDRGTWHRMGDAGRMDEEGRLWFYGRKSHRVITKDGILYTIPCEAVYNRHPKVSRSALVGIPDGRSGYKRPVIIIQPEPGIRPSRQMINELLELGASSGLTSGISDILFMKEFPVDPRHNAKIFREKLARWAVKKIK